MGIRGGEESTRVQPQKLDPQKIAMISRFCENSQNFKVPVSKVPVCEFSMLQGWGLEGWGLGLADVLSFFGGSLLHERKESPLPTRGFRGTCQKNDTCLTLYCCAWRRCTSVIVVRVRRAVPRGLPGAHKIACPWFIFSLGGH